MLRVLWFKVTWNRTSLAEYTTTQIHGQVNFPFNFLGIAFLDLILIYNYVNYLSGSKVKSAKQNIQRSLGSLPC